MSTSFRSLTRHGFERRALHGDMSISRSVPRRWSASRTARSGCWSPATSRPAASTFRVCRTSSILTCRTTPRIMSTASAAPDGPGGRDAALTLAAPEDGKKVAAIEKLISKQSRSQPIPDLAPPSSMPRKGRPRRRARGDRARPPRRATRPETPPANRPKARAAPEPRTETARPLRRRAKRDNVAVFRRPAPGRRPAPP